MSAVDKDGASYRETLRGLLKRARDPKKRAEIEAELAAQPLPSALAYLWRHFLRLSNRRGRGSHGPALIGWSEMEAYQRLTAVRFQPWEVEMIEMLDGLYVAEFSKLVG